MKQINLVCITLILLSFLTNFAFAVEPTPNIVQYPDYQKYYIVSISIIIAIAIIVIAMAYMFSDKELVIKSLKDIYNFLCNNPSIFLISLILSVILLTATIGIDSLKPLPPSPEDFGGTNMEYHLATSSYFINTLLFTIIDFIISFLIMAYFAAVFFCFIKNPVIGDSFSRAKKFYIRLLLLGILIGISLCLLFILIMILSFIAMLIIKMLSAISHLLSAILLLILYIVVMAVFVVIMLKIIFAVPIMIYENKGVIDSVKGSWNLTKGVLLSIFVVSSLATIVYISFPIIVLIFLPSISISQYLYNLLIYLMSPVSYIATAMLYFNIRKNR